MSQAEAQFAARRPIEAWLQGPSFCVGEISVTRHEQSAYVVCHRDDAERSEWRTYTDAEDGAKIARYDDAGKYRPLKTAPNLQHGWRMILTGEQEVRLALELFYPGRLAAYSAWVGARLRTTPLRETLERQSGMYRIAAKITEAQADRLVHDFCRSDGGCLRTIVWKRDAKGTPPSVRLPTTKYKAEFDQTGRGEDALPMFCQEACSLLVAQAREVVKSTQ